MTDELATPPPPTQPASAPSPDQSAMHGLTKRELEILSLMAAGESNRAIGERLFISSTTVASHISHIYGKLEVDTRAKAVAFAHRHDLA
jgi:DNA-binding NarL/FixJ family response regulator